MLKSIFNRFFTEKVGIKPVRKSCMALVNFQITIGLTPFWSSRRVQVNFKLARVSLNIYIGFYIVIYAVELILLQ